MQETAPVPFLPDEVGLLRDEMLLLRKERDYYKRHADELAGEAVKRDYTISTLRHALRQKRQGFALLAELQQYIGSERKLQEIFGHTIRRINAALGMDKSVVLAPGERANHYLPDVWSGFEPGFEPQRQAFEIEIAEEWARSGAALLVHQATPVTPVIRQLQEAFDLPHLVLVPVVVTGDPIRLLLTGRQREQRPFAPPLDEGDVDTLQAISALIGAFVHNHQLADLREDNELLRYLATVDKLTGIPNRRSFEEAFHREWTRAQRRGAALSLLMLDVDRFKQCNDTHGHGVGDAILKQVAQRITQALRPGDFGARYGGEEFVVILPDTEMTGAAAVAERVRRHIEATPMSHTVNDLCSQITVSIGVASLGPRDGIKSSRLITLADKALYEAKRLGRNRIAQARP